jgi:hypothetical protein
LFFGLTNHDSMLPERNPECQSAVFGGFGRLRFSLGKRVGNRTISSLRNHALSGLEPAPANLILKFRIQHSECRICNGPAAGGGPPQGMVAHRKVRGWGMARIQK